MNPLLVAVLVAGVFGSAFQAQPPAQKPVRAKTIREDDEKTRILVDVTRVNILLAVTDKKGRFITDLVKNDFEVSENKRQQDIMEFTAETDLPLRLAILVDAATASGTASGSFRRRPSSSSTA